MIVRIEPMQIQFVVSTMISSDRQNRPAGNWASLMKLILGGGDIVLYVALSNGRCGFVQALTKATEKVFTS